LYSATQWGNISHVDDPFHLGHDSLLDSDSRVLAEKSPYILTLISEVLVRKRGDGGKSFYPRKAGMVFLDPIFVSNLHLCPLRG